MKKLFPYIVLLITFLASCKKQEIEKPKVIYEATSKSKSPVEADTNLVAVADLPIHMEGTNYLIFPLGNLKSGAKALKSSYDSEEGFTVSNYGEYQITGYLQNLKFQEIGKDSIYALTDKSIVIQTATYLKALADKTKKQFLVYTLADMDTNKDNKLDASDIKSLYISDSAGNFFTKISADYQELIDWKLMENKARLYFRTIEDSNKNGEFDKEDTIHYLYLNILDKEWKAIEYHPI
jgi:hypothetical protein